MKGLDAILTYPTPKIVRIHDPKLALLRYALLALIFTFIVVFHIMYRGSHLNVAPVNGVVRLQLRDPSENSCDPFYQNCTIGFKSMSSLPYCKQNNFTGVYQKPCEYYDSVELRQVADEGILIPTRAMRFLQHKKCRPSFLNNFKCRSLFEFVGKDHGLEKQGGIPAPVRDVFVADIERYDVLLDHSAHSAGATSAGVQSYDFQMVGKYLECPNKNDEKEACDVKPVLCVHSECPAGAMTPEDASPSLSQAGSVRDDAFRRQPSYQALEAAEGENPDLQNEFELADAWLRKEFVVSTTKGDVFKLGNLVKTAGVSLDGNVSHGSEQTYRNDGFALVLRIEYTNIQPWIGLQVTPWSPSGPKMHYTYRVMTHATGDVTFRKVQYNHNPADSLVTRTVEEYRGIRIVVQQIGSIKVWDTMQLMFLVTTTLALLAVANCILDSVALRCMARSSEYESLKFETAGP
jgi:hypothetical protein